jgi:lipopolysaccharide export system protein LptA
MHAYGNVVVTTPEEVARGQRGTYNARTGIAVLTGSVKITRDKNQLNGDAAEMNLNTNVSRIIAAPNGSNPPVRALLIPNEKKDAAPKTTGDQPPGGAQR